MEDVRQFIKRRPEVATPAPIAPCPRKMAARPAVEMGSGATPPRIIKHGPKVEMGSGVAPPRISKYC